MKESIFDKVIQSLKQAAQHNSSIMVKPEVILWPDPDRQWESVIPILQEKISYLLILGHYQPEKKQGPAIWLKCMIAKTLPEATWIESETPIIYLPGLSKQDFKNISTADLSLQPLMEYQYTGTLWLHENGKEWTVPAFVQNAQAGLGVKMVQDNATKDALLAALPSIFQDTEVFYNKTFVDAEFLLATIFPDIISNILKWMAEGDSFMNTLSAEKRETFINLCRTRYEFEPDYRNIKEIAFKLGSQKNAWVQVWQYFANSPKKYPKIPELLGLAKPDDLGIGIFALPENSWPQTNEDKENQLRNALLHISKIKITEVFKTINQLFQTNINRKETVWHELGYAPLIDSLEHLVEMTKYCTLPFPSANLNELAIFYTKAGYKADKSMRKALAATQSEKDKKAVVSVITFIYRPWLERITQKFQQLIVTDPSPIANQKFKEETEDFLLFVDAFRYELAVEFYQKLRDSDFDVNLDYKWTALPTLTPTAKPYNSPIADLINSSSNCNEFRPQLNNGKDLQTAIFRDTLLQKDFHYAASVSTISEGEKTWMEIGDIDTKGHEEQANMVKRIEELYSSFLETIEDIFSKGVTRIKVVTDHGWLLLPGGLPKTELSKNLTETRWGRCALIKEGASSDLLHLPWRWNPSVFIAYAPGISFFKKNEEYAHGGLSVQECLIPEMHIQNSKKRKYSGKITSVKWNNLICKIEIEGVEDGSKVDIRTKPTDESTSIVISAEEKKLIKENKCSLMVNDSSEGSATWIILTTPTGIIIDKHMTSVGQ